MIDLTKAPEGATHYGISGTYGVCWYIVRDGYYKYIYDHDIGMHELEIGIHKQPVYDIMPINKWTIYNNTKPLCELTDEQAAELFNHKRHGGVLQAKSDLVGWLNIERPQWDLTVIYRAKQKSESELFVEATLLATKPFSMDVEIVKAIAEDMFNAGFKVPEDKKC